MRNVNEQKPSTLRAAVFVLLVMLSSVGHALAQGPPTGPAGGDLSGTYPNPVLAADRVRKVGDTMTGQLTILMPGTAGLINPFSLSASGNAGPDRGIAFLFNLPANPSAAFGAQMVAARETFGLPSYLSFGTHNGTAVAEALRITSSGKVGIGTGIPTNKLEVLASDGEAMRLYRNTATGGWGVAQKFALNNSSGTKVDYAGVHGISVTTVPGSEAGDLVFTTATGGSLTEKMRVTGNGHVSIGAGTVPGYRFVVQEAPVLTNGEHFLTSIRTGSSGTDAQLLMGYRADGAVVTGSLIRTANNKPLFFGTSSATTAMTILDSGNVGIGITAPLTKLHVAGDGKFTGSLTVDGSIAAKYQDVAEWVESSQRLAAGTVVVLDHTKFNQVIASTQAYDTRVAGVISAQPGITLGESGESKVLVATTGRVKIKVDATSAPIQVGDLLVTGDREGFAMKSAPVNIGGVQLHRPGTLVGKALEPLEKGTGEILVLLSLQ